jgi:glucose-6-phosphate 1-dehydrogenase
MIARLVLFGATGDLTDRFLLPALAQLSAAGQLPHGFSVIGAARARWDDDAFRINARQQLEQHASDLPADVRDRLVSRLHYHPVDVTDRASVEAVLRTAAGDGEGARVPVVAYLALPTALIPPTVTALGQVGLPPGSRIAVEKPFGEDAQGARDLNALLAEVLREDAGSFVFRVDHVLGMATMQNLLVLRFGNRVLAPLWNGQHIEEIQVLWEETLALEGRAAFYDRAGVLKDVMQNHLIQVLGMAAMEPPDGVANGPGQLFPAQELRRRKIELLRAVREVSAQDVISRSRRARYTAGRLANRGGADGRAVPDYVHEDGVDPHRATETYAEVVLEVANQRWAGTRFRLRAGKALAERRKGILIRFRPLDVRTRTGAIAGADESSGDALWIGIDGPNEIALRLLGSTPDASHRLTTVSLVGSQPESRLSPYAHVLLNLLQGRTDLSVSGEEAEQAWRIMTPIREAWDQGLVPMEEYPAGSTVPSPGTAQGLTRNQRTSV